MLVCKIWFHCVGNKITTTNNLSCYFHTMLHSKNNSENSVSLENLSFCWFSWRMRINGISSLIFQQLPVIKQVFRGVLWRYAYKCSHETSWIFKRSRQVSCRMPFNRNPYIQKKIKAARNMWNCYQSSIHTCCHT